MQTSTTWSTSGLAERPAFKFWNEALSASFQRVETERRVGAAPFSATLTSIGLGKLTVNTLQAQGYRVSQHPSDQDDWLFINLHRQGRCRLRQHGREQCVQGAGISLNVGASPFDLEFGDGMEMSCLRLPLQKVAERAPAIFDAVARPLRDDAKTALFSSLAGTVATHAAALSPACANVLCDTLTDLLALAIGPSVRQQESARTSLRRELMRRTCAYVEQQFSRPDLDIDEVAVKMRTSLRTLQALFRAQGTTFTQHVLEQRLLAADMLLLTEPGRRIGEVAYAVGFSDLSYFCRSFRARFGMAPKQRRECGAGHPKVDHQPVTDAA